jgi:hypothetical protein
VLSISLKAENRKAYIYPHLNKYNNGDKELVEKSPITCPRDLLYAHE